MSLMLVVTFGNKTIKNVYMIPAINQDKFPLISIIIPVYQVEQYIYQCAESLFQQDWPNLELIFVDNNTKDRSIEIVKELIESKYPQCKDFTHFIFQEKPGLGFAREAGIRVAKGEYIIHVDSDDWVERDYISTLAKKAVESNADLVYCGYYREYADEKPTVKSKDNDFTGKTAGEFIFAMHNNKVPAYMWNKLMHRSLYDIDNLIIPIRNMHEDMVFQTQLAYGAKNIVYVPRHLYHYRCKRKDAITVMSWADKRVNSAEGLFYLYNNLPKTDSPLDYCAQDLLMRATWYALSTFNFETVNSNPDIVRFIKDMDYARGHRVPLSKQRVMKYYCKAISRVAKGKG